MTRPSTPSGSSSGSDSEMGRRDGPKRRGRGRVRGQGIELARYALAGVPHLWLVDPADHTL